MSQLRAFTERIVAFRDERDWRQFHNLPALLDSNPNRQPLSQRVGNLLQVCQGLS